MEIVGIEGKTDSQVRKLVAEGGKFVIFSYCISLLVVTFKRSSDIYFIAPGESAAAKSLPFTLLSLFLGWWGFPFGLIYTPMAIIGNLSGGKDVTQDVLALSPERPDVAALRPAPVHPSNLATPQAAPQSQGDLPPSTFN